MSRPEEFLRASARTAREIVERFNADPQARERVRPDWTPGRYFTQLVDREDHVAAAEFLAYALPKREAVWWACLCARQSPATPASSAALEAAEKWVVNPTDENRRSGMAAALDAGLMSPAACAALAAFVSEGSVAPVEAPPVLTGENATAQTVAGSILLAAAAQGEEKMAARLKACVGMGLDVACGRVPWSQSR
jgi:hypothetical protein